MLAPMLVVLAALIIWPEIPLCCRTDPAGIFEIANVLA